MPAITATTIDAYIAEFPRETQAVLEERARSSGGVRPARGDDQLRHPARST